jgi:chorismate synthase
VKLLSGTMPENDGETLVTTGTPISMMIENVDQRSKDYGEIATRYRPGHADYTYDMKYGIRDYRGGGRSSARETAARVAAGAIARKVVPGLKVHGALVAMGEKDIDRNNWDWSTVEREDNPFFTPDEASIPVFADYLDGIRKAGSSVGAIIEIVAYGVPAGLGAPIYGKLDQDIASFLMSINAVKGVEIGNGFEAARLTGEDNADQMRIGKDGKPHFLSNQAGGILGGISTGMPVVARFAVKPTSSILTPRKSVDSQGNEVEVVTKGRHDPCVGIRAVPIGEAMVACAIADHYLRHRGQTGRV